ncbi:MAG: HEAT repeat domain-containing protein [Planctomycetota bacterium]
MPEETPAKPNSAILSEVPSPKSPLRKTLRVSFFFLVLLLIGGIAFGEEIQIYWNFFLLESQKAEVGDQARNFLVVKNQFSLLFRGLTHKNLQVRRQASFAMHQLWKHPDVSKAIPFLLRYLKDPQTDTKIKWHSIRALGYLRVHQAVPDLIEVFFQDDILCTNPTCRHYHLWEESHEALERILEVRQDFHPGEGAEHRNHIAHQWKKYWEKFQKESLQPLSDDKKITTPY